MGKWNELPHEPQYLCGAKAKHNGRLCRPLSMDNRRCYWHDANNTGANNPHRAVKHGLRTKEAVGLRKQFATLMCDTKKFMEEMSE